MFLTSHPRDHAGRLAFARGAQYAAVGPGGQAVFAGNMKAVPRPLGAFVDRSNALWRQKGNAGDGDDMGQFFGRPSQITSGRFLAAPAATDRPSATGGARSPQTSRHRG